MVLNNNYTILIEFTTLKRKTRAHETTKSPMPLCVSTSQNMNGAHVSAPSWRRSVSSPLLAFRACLIRFFSTGRKVIKPKMDPRLLTWICLPNGMQSLCFCGSNLFKHSIHRLAWFQIKVIHRVIIKQSTRAHSTQIWTEHVGRIEIWE